MSVLRRAWGYVWLNDPEWSAEDRKEAVLVRKLDFFFCSYIILSSLCKYLDQTNISNAYVSGLQEDLHILGNQYNLFTTFFNIGYMTIIPISSYLMNTRIRPSLLMPTSELIWGVTTGCFAAVKNYQQIYGLRFLVGFAEGTAWPGTMVLLLSWYTPAELGKRLAIYEVAAYSGGIFGGALQSALYTNLNGTGGLSGWRWLFVVNSCVTVGVAAWGYFGCPDYPHRPNPWAKWLKKEDVEVAQRRMARQKRAMPKGWSVSTFKYLFSRPENYGIWLCMVIGGQATNGTSYFNLWLKSLKNADGTSRYSIPQLNTIPIAGNCTTILFLLTILPLVDYLGIAWPFLAAMFALDVIFTGILAAWNVPDAAKFASFIVLNGTYIYQHIIVAWIGTLVKDNAEARAFIIGSMVSAGYAINAGVPVKVWPSSQAPHYPIGWKYALGMSVFALLACFWTAYWHRFRQRKESGSVDEETSKSGEKTPDGEWTDEKADDEKWTDQQKTMIAVVPVTSAHGTPATFNME